MNTLSLFKACGFSIGLFIAGCASTPESSSERRIVLGKGGAFAVVDENGNPVEDESLELIGELLSQTMAASEAPEELTDEEIWSIDAEGNFTHIQSGGICPYTWGEFSLVRPSIFKRDGSDVGCSFESSSLNASYTFYFYKNSEPIDQELDGVISAIQSRNPTAKEVELNYLGPEPRFYIGRVLETVIDGGSAKRDASLIAEKAGWRVKLRMTYATNDAIGHEQNGALMLRGQVDRIGNDFIGANPENNDAAAETDA